MGFYFFKSFNPAEDRVKSEFEIWKEFQCPLDGFTVTKTGEYIKNIGDDAKKTVATDNVANNEKFTIYVTDDAQVVPENGSFFGSRNPVSLPHVQDYTGRKYYNLGGDNSFGCTSTDAVLGILCVVLAFWSILKLKIFMVPAKNEPRMSSEEKLRKTTGFFFILSLILFGAGYATAAYWHWECAHKWAKCYNKGWNLIQFCTNVGYGAAFVSYVGFYLLCKMKRSQGQINDSDKNDQTDSEVSEATEASIYKRFVRIYAPVILLPYLTLSILKCYLDAGFIVDALIGLITSMFGVIMVACHCCGCTQITKGETSFFGKRKHAALLFIAGFILGMTGVAIQVVFAGACQTPCPTAKKCPFSGPNFNNNAVFHLFQMINILLQTIAFTRLLTFTDPEVMNGNSSKLADVEVDSSKNWVILKSSDAEGIQVITSEREGGSAIVVNTKEPLFTDSERMALLDKRSK